MSQYRRKKEEHEELTKELQFSNWFWNPGGENFAFGKNLFITLLATCIIGLIGYATILNFSIPNAIIGMGILIGLLITVKVSSSSWSHSRAPDRALFITEYEDFAPYFIPGRDDVLFFEENGELTGFGLFRLKAIPRALRGYFERLIRSLYQEQIPIYWLWLQSPVEQGAILDSPALSEKARTHYMKQELGELESRMESHGGMWVGRLIFGTRRTLAITEDIELARIKLYRQVIADLFKIFSAFRNAFPHTIPELLRGKELVTTLELSITGGARPSFYLSGEEAARHFIQVPRIITKSMDYHYPAEFIVPTNVPFDIGPIGKAFETEFEQEEVPIGLRLEDMLNGLLVVGGTPEERHLINFKLVFEAVISEVNYLVVTSNKEWRRILDVVPESCVLRLGEDLTINPLDPETDLQDPTQVNAYATALAEAFAQVFYLSRLGIERLLEILHTCLIEADSVPDLEKLKEKLTDQLKEPRAPAKNELYAVLQFVQNIAYSKTGLIFGETVIPFNQLMRGVTVIEVDAMTQQHLQFLLFCLLVKMLSYGHDHPDQQCAVLIDQADELVSLPPDIYKSREIEPYLLDWTRRFRRAGIGLHLSVQTPSRFPRDVMNPFQTIISCKVTAWEDVKLMSNLLQLLPDRLVHSRERLNNYQEEYLKTLPLNTFILKRSDINNAFPVQTLPFDLSETHLWDSAEIQERLRITYRGWQRPDLEIRPVLEMNFGRDVGVVQQILSLLTEYPQLGKQGLLSSLNSAPEIELDMNDLNHLLYRLVDLDYIATSEWSDGRGHLHNSYQLKEKGERIYQAYLADLRQRMQLQESQPT